MLKRGLPPPRKAARAAQRFPGHRGLCKPPPLPLASTGPPRGLPGHRGSRGGPGAQSEARDQPPLKKRSRKQTIEDRRAKAARVASTLPVAPQLSILQRASVQPMTAEKYREMYDSFSAFLRHRGVPPPLDEGQWDAAVATMLDYMYLDGRKVHEGQKLLAAVLWYHPQLTRNAGGRMAVARQSLRGWRRLDPSTGRLPIPLPVVHMIATWLMATERRHLGLLVLMTMESTCAQESPSWCGQAT